MRIVSLKYNVAFLVCVLTLSTNAQNAKQDILKINEAYSKFSHLSMNITYNLFKNYTANVPFESESGYFQQQGTLRYSKLKEIESLQNKNCLVVIDNEDKLIVVGNPVKFNAKKITLLDLDTALTKCSSVSFIDAGSTLSCYKMSFRQDIVSEFDAIDLYFNKKSFLVEKMVFYYREKIRINEEDETSPKEKPKLEVVFSKMKFDKISDETFYSETRFVEKRKGKYFPVSAYSEYELIDQKIAK